jgi:hypothetical protein
MVIAELFLYISIYVLNFGYEIWNPESLYVLFVFLSLFSVSFLMKNNRLLQEQSLVLLSSVLVLSLSFKSDLMFLNLVNFLIYGGFICWQFKHLNKGKFRVLKIFLIVSLVFYNQFEVYKFIKTGESELFLGFVVIPFLYSLYISFRSSSSRAPALYWIVTNLFLALACIPYLEYIGSIHLHEDFYFLLIGLLSVFWICIAMVDVLKLSPEKTYYIKLFIIFISCCGLLKVFNNEKSLEVLLFFSACLVLSHSAPLKIKTQRFAGLLLFGAFGFLVSQSQNVPQESLKYFFLFVISIAVSLVSINKLKNTGSFKDFETTSWAAFLKLSVFAVSAAYIMGGFH